MSKLSKPLPTRGRCCSGPWCWRCNLPLRRKMCIPSEPPTQQRQRCWLHYPGRRSPKETSGSHWVRRLRGCMLYLQGTCTAQDTSQQSTCGFSVWQTCEGPCAAHVPGQQELLVRTLPTCHWTKHAPTMNIHVHTMGSLSAHITIAIDDAAHSLKFKGFVAT